MDKPLIDFLVKFIDNKLDKMDVYFGDDENYIYIEDLRFAFDKLKDEIGKGV